MENKPNISMILVIVGVMIIAAAGIGLMMHNNAPAPTTTTIAQTTTSQVTTTIAAPTTIPSTTRPAQTTTTAPLLGNLPTTTTYNIPAGSNVHTVEIINFQFVPKELTIKKGDTVTWINNDIIGNNPRIHLLNQYNGEFRSGRLGYKDTFSHTFNKPGKYVYMDSIFISEIKGTVNVLDDNGNMPTGSFIAQLNPMSGNPIFFLLLSVIVAGMVTGYILGFRKQSY